MAVTGRWNDLRAKAGASAFTDRDGTLLPAPLPVGALAGSLNALRAMATTSSCLTLPTAVTNTGRVLAALS